MSPKEYKQGMVINRWLHNLERLLYARAEWISHTNETREQLFTNDIGIKKKLSTYTLPNYPSGNWYTIASKVNRNNRPEIGFVYVGALSMHTMFTKEMALFISNNVGKCYWDIYSDNCEAEVMSFLKELAAPNISFKESVSYNTLPQILPRYDIGVILYKGDTPNYAYNAPNKFFEYSAAGLTVWFPPGMKGMMPYEQQEKKPFVLCVEFDNLTLPSESEARRIEQLPAQMYLAENVYSRLWEKINKK
ncbi:MULTISPECIES: glycosyltransferase family protein [Niastella]|uniref:Uncharacterized protein n=1 Tax=Niastella soli TaxID=2821487 RepID=A0ABS3YRF1_9BACT|nr:hypothetical protein [Niastella soli]MBO9200157.1 hypothetical protein [Niastella soli]